jgi:hypothetical protein
MESTTVVGKYICDIPVYFGEVKFMSHGVGITSTILWYYFFSALWTNGGNSSNPDGYAFQSNRYAWVIFGAFFGISLLQFLMLIVQSRYAKCSVTIVGFLLSWIIGIFIATVFFFVVWAWDRDQLPYFQEPETFANLSFKGGFGRDAPKSLVKDPAKKESDDVQQSSKMDDKDEFVCDLYKNGQLITSTISE